MLLLLLAVASIATQRSPDSVGICEFTPASETISLSWASIGQFMSQVFSYGPAGSGYCLVPKATTKATWLTQLEPSQGYIVGSGDNSITGFSSENTSTSPREGLITLGGGFNLTVQQTGYPTISCQYSPATIDISLSGSGGTVNTIYTAAVIPTNHDGCIIYAMKSSVPWITILYPTTNMADSGADTLEPEFTVASNPGGARVGYVTSTKNLIIKVTQMAVN